MRWSYLRASSHSPIRKLKTNFGVRKILLISVVLFDLFDFNEIQSLSSMDLEFAIQCVLISTSKIFNIGADLNETEITTMVRQAFNDGVRITLP